MKPLKLRPEYRGNFEVFSEKSEKRYARLSLRNGEHFWYFFDVFTESYQRLRDEALAEALEDAYRKAPIVPPLI